MSAESQVLKLDALKSVDGSSTLEFDASAKVLETAQKKFVELDAVMENKKRVISMALSTITLTSNPNPMPGIPHL